MVGNNKYWKLVEENRCTKCGKDLPDNWQYRMCPVCKDEFDRERKKRYQRLKEQEKCTRCKADISDFDRSDAYCEECLDKIEEDMDYENAWTEWHEKRIEEEVKNMPDYLVEQYLKGLEDLVGEEINHEGVENV